MKVSIIKSPYHRRWNALKKVINKKTYNTETAKQLKKFVFGDFGNPEGYEEILMQTARGLFFIYGIGGKESKYSEETIIPITEKEAQIRIKENESFPHISENA